MVLIAISMVMPLSIVRWEACPLKLIIFRSCMVLSPAVGICAGWNLPRLRWVLRAAAGFCLLLLCSACCCWCCLLPAAACCCLLLPAAACCCLLLPAAACCCLLLACCCLLLPAAAGFWLLLLGSASCCCCWVLPYAAGFCLVLLGSALCFWVLPAAAGFCLLVLRQCAMPQCAQYFACRLPLHVIQPSDLLSGSLLLPGLGSRVHLVLISFLIAFFQA